MRRPYFVILILLLAGCQGSPSAGPAPGRAVYRTPPGVMRRLAERARGVRSVSASGSLTLRGAGGDATTLDVALAAGDDRLRLRAWKFNQAVFDLTLNEDGLWLWSGDRADAERGEGALGATAERLARAWGVIRGDLLLEPPDDLQDRRGGPLIARYERESGGAVLARIDRETLTVRRYTLLGPSGRPRLTLALDDYARIAGRLWPRRVVAAGPRRRLTLRLHDVTLNQPPPPGAFTPPPRATRRP